MRDSVQVAFVRERSARNRVGGTTNLKRDVPATTGETEHHADGEENTPYEGLETHVEE